jgi:hypothetical protein
MEHLIDGGNSRENFSIAAKHHVFDFQPEVFRDDSGGNDLSAFDIQYKICATRCDRMGRDF